MTTHGREWKIFDSNFSRNAHTHIRSYHHHTITTSSRVVDAYSSWLREVHLIAFAFFASSFGSAERRHPALSNGMKYLISFHVFISSVAGVVLRRKVKILAQNNNGSELSKRFKSTMKTMMNSFAAAFPRPRPVIPHLVHNSFNCRLTAAGLCNNTVFSFLETRCLRAKNLKFSSTPPCIVYCGRAYIEAYRWDLSIDRRKHIHVSHQPVEPAHTVETIRWVNATQPPAASTHRDVLHSVWVWKVLAPQPNSRLSRKLYHVYWNTCEWGIKQKLSRRLIKFIFNSLQTTLLRLLLRRCVCGGVGDEGGWRALTNQSCNFQFNWIFFASVFVLLFHASVPEPVCVCVCCASQDIRKQSEKRKQLCGGRRHR